MLRFLLRRLVIIPIALMAINFLGYGYATSAQQVNAAANPFIARRESAPPLLSSYLAYVSGLFAPPDTQDAQAAEPVAVVPFVLAAAGNSMVLLLLSFGLGAGLGLALGLFAVRTESGRVGRWLSPVASVGMALPSFFLGAILIAASIAVTIARRARRRAVVAFSWFWLGSPSRVAGPGVDGSPGGADRQSDVQSAGGRERQAVCGGGKEHRE